MLKAPWGQLRAPAPRGHRCPSADLMRTQQRSLDLAQAERADLLRYSQEADASPSVPGEIVGLAAMLGALRDAISATFWRPTLKAVHVGSNPTRTGCTSSLVLQTRILSLQVFNKDPSHGSLSTLIANGLNQRPPALVHQNESIFGADALSTVFR